MPISNAVIGTQTSADVFFFNNLGQPFQATAPASFVVRTQNNLMVAQGICTQDANNAAHWSATFTVPNSAPPTSEGQFYTIVFSISNNSTVNNQTFSFTVNSSIQVDDFDTAIVVLQGQPFTVNLRVPFNSLQTLSLRFLNVNGGVLVQPSTATVPLDAPIQQGNQFIYPIPVNATDSAFLNVPNYGVSPYLAYINYTTPDGAQETQVSMVYIVIPTTLNLMNDIRRYCDRIRNNDIIPQLRITDIDLLHFAMQGIEMLNALPPSNFTFNLQTLVFSPQFFFYAQTGACIKLLEAQYLGYGMSSFQFQGQAVQLEYDVTSYIMSVIELLRQDFANATLAKNHWARSGGFSSGRIASIGGSWGPLANLVFAVSPLSLPGGFPVLPFLG
jgi:hypothetical protein